MPSLSFLSEQLVAAFMISSPVKMNIVQYGFAIYYMNHAMWAKLKIEGALGVFKTLGFFQSLFSCSIGFLEALARKVSRCLPLAAQVQLGLPKHALQEYSWLIQEGIMPSIGNDVQLHKQLYSHAPLF